jgi:hypothetical protein
MHTFLFINGPSRECARCQSNGSKNADMGLLSVCSEKGACLITYLAKRYVGVLDSAHDSSAVSGRSPIACAWLIGECEMAEERPDNLTGEFRNDPSLQNLRLGSHNGCND